MMVFGHFFKGVSVAQKSAMQACLLPLAKCLLNISDIFVQAMNALRGVDSYCKEVVGEYMKE